MEWFNVVLVALVICHCHSSAIPISCTDMFTELPFGEVECIQNKEEEEVFEDSNCEVDATNITWSEVPSDTGKVSVKFNLLPSSCGYNAYRLSLYMDESITSEDECLRTSSTFGSLHSERTVEIINSASNETSIPSCGKTATVTFNYVFTGCYVLELASVHTVPDIINKSVPKFLETSFGKNLLVEKLPKQLSITSQYNPVGRQIDVGIQFDSIEDLYVSFRLSDDIDPLRERACYVSGHEHSCCIYMPSGQFMCRLRNQRVTTPKCNANSNEIRCTIENVTAGYYCVLLELHDDRCVPGTLWNQGRNSCIFNSRPLNVTLSLPMSLPTETSTPGIWWMLVATFTILLLVFLCVLLYIWRKRRPSPDPGPDVRYEKQPVPVRPKILLLYSRDCQPFMNLMITFRNILKEVTKCEVYDCFDPALMDKIACNKQDWVRRYLLRSDVKVVVIETACAVLRQKAVFNHFIMTYLESSWLDPLFLYGLKGLTDDIEKNTYGRVFVVRFHGLTEDSCELSHLTPYTRYIIPQHLEKLLNSLYQVKMHHSQSGITAAQNSVQNSEYTLCRDENTDNSIQKLQEDIRNVENYKRQNPNYLDSLLAMTSAVSV